jgi:predicted NAD/FAD-binding protein
MSRVLTSAVQSAGRTVRTIAVVGSGIAGLSAAWLLSRRYAVTLFEAQDWLGGHTHTVDVELDGVVAPVDTGFLVFNERTYPNLSALFAHLGVIDAASDMSFSVRIDDERLEWAGSNLATLFAQRRNLLRPAFWSMLRDIARFNRQAGALVESGELPAGSLGDFLAAGGYGPQLRDWYLLPMAAAIWSCPTRQMLDYPCATFLRFCHNHGLLALRDRPRWRTVAGGGREYVRRMAVRIRDLRCSTAVQRVLRDGGRVTIVSDAGIERFDAVVLACHTDQSLRLLGDADADERHILGAVRYQPNCVVLHTDRSFLPHARRAWASWNYTAGAGAPGTRPVSVSYLLNRLQPLPFRTPLIETLNPFREPAPGSVLARFEYSHPVFDAGALRAQRELPAIQGRRATWFCGAWTGYGFHEDGLRSGMAVAAALGVDAPWQARPLVPRQRVVPREPADALAA